MQKYIILILDVLFIFVFLLRTEICKNKTLCNINLQLLFCILVANSTLDK